MVKDFRVIYKGVKVGGGEGWGCTHRAAGAAGGAAGARGARAQRGPTAGRRAAPRPPAAACSATRSGTHCFAHCFAILKITFQICINHSNIVFAYPFPAGPGRAQRRGGGGAGRVFVPAPRPA